MGLVLFKQELFCPAYFAYVSEYPDFLNMTERELELVHLSLIA